MKSVSTGAGDDKGQKMIKVLLGNMNKSSVANEFMA